MDAIHEMVKTDNDPEHWVYDRAEETPEGNGPCMLVYDYIGPHSSVMLPETIDGLPVAGVSLFTYTSDIYASSFCDTYAAELYFPPTAHWLRSGDYWARLEPVGESGIMMERMNPEKRKWRLFGTACARLCTVLKYAAGGASGELCGSLLFVSRAGVWANADIAGYPISGPDDVYCDDPVRSQNSSGISLEKLRDDVENLPEHGALSYCFAYCCDYGMGTDVYKLTMQRCGDTVAIKSDFGIPNHAVDYQTLCKGLHAAGLNELTQTLDNAGCPVLYELLEPRYCEAHNIPCRPEEEMPKEE